LDTQGLAISIQNLSKDQVFLRVAFWFDLFAGLMLFIKKKEKKGEERIISTSKV